MPAFILNIHRGLSQRRDLVRCLSVRYHIMAWGQWITPQRQNTPPMQNITLYFCWSLFSVHITPPFQPSFSSFNKGLNKIVILECHYFLTWLHRRLEHEGITYSSRSPSQKPMLAKTNQCHFMCICTLNTMVLFLKHLTKWWQDIMYLVYQL